MSRKWRAANVSVHGLYRQVTRRTAPSSRARRIFPPIPPNTSVFLQGGPEAPERASTAGFHPFFHAGCLVPRCGPSPASTRHHPARAVRARAFALRPTRVRLGTAGTSKSTDGCVSAGFLPARSRLARARRESLTQRAPFVRRVPHLDVKARNARAQMLSGEARHLVPAQIQPSFPGRPARPAFETLRPVQAV